MPLVETGLSCRFNQLPGFFRERLSARQTRKIIARPSLRSLERYPKRKLKGSWIAHGRSLLECGRGVRGICSRAKRAVQRYAIDMIRQIEPFGEGLQPETFRELKASAEPGIQIEEVKTRSRIAVNENSIDRWPGRGALNRVSSRRDVEW